MYIIPAIDLYDNHCVRLERGDFSKMKKYAVSPLEMARKFDDAGFQHLHVVDLQGTREGKFVHEDMLKQICRNTGLKVDFGGGVRRIADMEKAFACGIWKLNVGTMAITNPVVFEVAIQQFGVGRIIVSADVHDQHIAIRGWQEKTILTLDGLLKRMAALHLDFLSCTDIHRDGMLRGVNVALYRQIRETCPELNVIASGGVSDLEDLAALRDVGVFGTIVGKAIYEGNIQLSDLVTFQGEGKN